MNEDTKCLIVEDQYPDIQLLKRHIETYPGLTFSESCGKSSEIWDILKKQKIDLIFLDIGLEDGEQAGVNFLEHHGDNPELPMIIVMTASEKNHEAFKNFWDIRSINSVKERLLKPITYEKFEKAIQSIFNESDTDLDNVFIKEECLYVKFQDENIDDSQPLIAKIKFGEILYISTQKKRRDKDDMNSRRDYKESIEKNKIAIFTKEREFIIKSSLNKLSDRLPMRVFQRVGDAHIVNASNIKYVSASRTHLYMENLSGRIPVGDNYKKNLPQDFFRFSL